MAQTYDQGQKLSIPLTLRAAATFALLAAGWWAYDALTAKPAAQAAPMPVREPYVASETRLGPDELFRVVVVPHPLGKAFDMRCLLYTHGTAGVELVCPDARQDQLADRETDGVPAGAR